MIAVGCLPAVLLPLLGAVVGHHLGGASGSAWGLGLGLLLGCIVAFGVYRVGLKLRGD